MIFIFQGSQKMHVRVAIFQETPGRYLWYAPHFEAFSISEDLHLDLCIGTHTHPSVNCVYLTEWGGGSTLTAEGKKGGCVDMKTIGSENYADIICMCSKRNSTPPYLSVLSVGQNRTGVIFAQRWLIGWWQKRPSPPHRHHNGHQMTFWPPISDRSKCTVPISSCICC